MSWTQAIIRLQDVDHELMDHQKRLAAIEEELADTKELQAAKKQAATTEAAATEARKAQQELEFAVGQVQVKRERTESNLYSGRITNSRELEDLQAELQSLKRRISDLEDQLLEAMMAREEADAAAKQAAAYLEETQRQNELLQRALVEERDRLQAALADLKADREALLAQIPAGVLDSYDYLRDRIGTMPVARLTGDVCSVCGMVVTKPIQQQVQRGVEAYCNNCRRLLVA